jgi:hypothetical protein
VPVPVAGDALSQLELLEALQVQPEGVLTDTAAIPAPGVTVTIDGDKDTGHALPG